MGLSFLLSLFDVLKEVAYSYVLKIGFRLLFYAEDKTLRSHRLPIFLGR
jgi:hypothetical protein